MNKFLDELKYNVNAITHKAKKGLLVGGLSLLAASSFIGCSKSSSDTSESITQEKQSNSEELEQKFDYISSDADELATRLEALPSFSKLSDKDALDVSNFLLRYTFARTSQGYNGEVSANVMIPNMHNNLLDGTFSIPENAQVECFKFLNEHDSEHLYLNSDAVELYNDYITEGETTDNALSAIYTVKANLIEQNPDLLDNLSSYDILSLINSSYISAYNNKNSDNNYIRAVDTRLSINLVNENEQDYDIFWTVLSEDGTSYVLENNLEPSGNDLVDDYEEVCKKYYFNDSNSSMIKSLKEANEKNEVTTQEIISQLVDINQEKAQEENQSRQSSKTEHQVDESR